MEFKVPVSQTQYKLIEHLGEGLTSEVHKAIRFHPGIGHEQVVALKLFKSKKRVSVIKNEIQSLSAVDSAHCVRLLGWDELDSGFALVLEYLEGVSLLELYRSHQSLLDESLVNYVMAQVQKGLRDLHQHQISHGDLNGGNIFITKEGEVKLLDFGLSVKGAQIKDHGTPKYLAPEGWRTQKQSPYSDLFSLGLIHHELINGTLSQQLTERQAFERMDTLCNRNDLLRSDGEKRRFMSFVTSGESQSRLKPLVETTLRKKHHCVETVVLNPVPKKKSKGWTGAFLQAGPWVLSFAIGLSCVQTHTAIFRRNHSLEVRSLEWKEISVFRYSGEKKYPILLHGHTPLSLSQLEPGSYEAQWMSEGSTKRILVHLNQNKRIIIK